MLAETENVRLKQVVNDQMNITKNLQRMLRKPVKQLVRLLSMPLGIVWLLTTTSWTRL